MKRLFSFAAALFSFSVSASASFAACTAAQLEAHGVYQGRWETTSMDGWGGETRLTFEGNSVLLEDTTDTTPDGRSMHDWRTVRTSKFKIEDNGNIFFTYRTKNGSGKSVYTPSDDCSRLEGRVTTGKGVRIKDVVE